MVVGTGPWAAGHMFRGSRLAPPLSLSQWLAWWRECSPKMRSADLTQGSLPGVRRL